MSLLKKLFGSRNERVLQQLRKKVKAINALELKLGMLSDEQLAEKTKDFRDRFQNGETLDQLLVEAFALVREAAKRVFDLRIFDVQLLGGMVLHAGKIAEMRTGEGKTLAATLPSYLNALTGDGVHVVTVNDYLAQRDAAWMKPLFERLGLTVGVVVHDMTLADKQAAYQADVVYGTNNEFGFDYLRDNMAFSLEDKVQRKLAYAVVDEVDSILIDEARTPLVISGPSDESSALYQQIDVLIPKLTERKEEEGPGDYHLDEKARLAFLTESGHEHVERLLADAGILAEGESLYAPSNIIYMHHVNAALRAHTLYQRDVDYIVQNDEVMIIDDHTGRALPGRRWSDGLHQAVEAKEKVSVQRDNQTMASITFQNYFRLYDKLSGMTGTADTEAYEFQQIYGLEVIVMPTNKPMVREDLPDVVFLKHSDKFAAVVEDIQESTAEGRPVLVGTASIENSEYLSDLLNKANVKHQVLNAKFHEQEAKIIAEAGRPGAVTIATNMAGRGTDIVLGGNLDAEMAALGDKLSDTKKAEMEVDWKQRHEQVLNAGGLYVIGSERHESRRIDNQLRGRSGRQGDPGRSRFYLSLEDNLIRIFASERMAGLMQRFGLEEGVALESRLLTRAIENAQRKVEGRNFDIRKQLLEYDDVANDQRKVIYAQRNELLASEDLSEQVDTFREDCLAVMVEGFVPPNSLSEQWDIEGLEKQLISDFGLQLPLREWLEQEDEVDENLIYSRVLTIIQEFMAAKEERIGKDVMRHLERSILLQTLDSDWREHLSSMDYLRQGIHLRGFAQKNPKQEYKREAFALFASMLDHFKHETVSLLMRVEVQAESEVTALDDQYQQSQKTQALDYQHDALNVLSPTEPEGLMEAADAGTVQTIVRTQPKIGRNQPCHCGSGKKYKSCHGKL